MSDTEEMPVGGIGGAAVRAGARRGRGIRRNHKEKITCFSPVLSGGRVGAAHNPSARSGKLNRGASPHPTLPRGHGGGRAA